LCFFPEIGGRIFSPLDLQEMLVWKKRTKKIANHQSDAGLPDFSWWNIPKRWKIYQKTTKDTK
jgi:hypothetical protein